MWNLCRTSYQDSSTQVWSDAAVPTAKSRSDPTGALLQGPHPRCRDQRLFSHMRGKFLVCSHTILCRPKCEDIKKGDNLVLMRSFFVPLRDIHNNGLFVMYVRWAANEPGASNSKTTIAEGDSALLLLLLLLLGLDTIVRKTTAKEGIEPAPQTCTMSITQVLSEDPIVLIPLLVAFLASCSRGCVSQFHKTVPWPLPSKNCLHQVWYRQPVTVMPPTTTVPTTPAGLVVTLRSTSCWRRQLAWMFRSLFNSLLAAPIVVGSVSGSWTDLDASEWLPIMRPSGNLRFLVTQLEVRRQLKRRYATKTSRSTAAGHPFHLRGRLGCSRHVP
ncbi:hypothetical protein BD289DRAFT_168667 [Coniella lustricola]|uniref:Uncharacterized protein n=1 Tax=Coniella lustricola TaxID=2025994 RepID=A0A2T2ZU15_9PEZI|nr:hypothetical protein BD289DRAFT_168667 [Coniella lustricola]